MKKVADDAVNRSKGSSDDDHDTDDDDGYKRASSSKTRRSSVAFDELYNSNQSRKNKSVA